MLGQMRLEKMQGAERSDAALTASLQSLTGGANIKFVFEPEECQEWTRTPTDDMSKDERQMADDAWSKNNARDLDRSLTLKCFCFVSKHSSS